MKNFHTLISKYNKGFKKLCKICTKWRKNRGFYCAFYIFYYIKGEKSPF